MGTLQVNGAISATGTISASSFLGNASSADKLSTARTISLTGSVTGSGTFDGSGNLSIATTTNHTHSYLPLSGGTVTGTLTLSRTTDAAGATDKKPALIIGGASTAQHLEFDGNEIMSKSDGTTTATLHLNGDGGLVSIGSGGLKVNGDVNVNSGNLTTHGYVYAGTYADGGVILVNWWSDVGATYQYVLDNWASIPDFTTFTINITANVYPYSGCAFGYKRSTDWGSFIFLHYGDSGNGGTRQFINLYDGIVQLSNM